MTLFLSKTLDKGAVMPGLGPLHILISPLFVSHGFWELLKFQSFCQEGESWGFCFNSLLCHSIYGKAVRCEEMWFGCCCETDVPGRGLCHARSVLLVGKVVGRAFPIAAVVEMQVSISHADLCAVIWTTPSTWADQSSPCLRLCCHFVDEKEFWLISPAVSYYD